MALSVLLEIFLFVVVVRLGIEPTNYELCFKLGCKGTQKKWNGQTFNGLFALVRIPGRVKKQGG